MLLGGLTFLDAATIAHRDGDRYETLSEKNPEVRLFTSVRSCRRRSASRCAEAATVVSSPTGTAARTACSRNFSPRFAERSLGFLLSGMSEYSQVKHYRRNALVADCVDHSRNLPRFFRTKTVRRSGHGRRHRRRHSPSHFRYARRDDATPSNRRSLRRSLTSVRRRVLIRIQDLSPTRGPRSASSASWSSATSFRAAAQSNEHWTWLDGWVVCAIEGAASIICIVRGLDKNPGRIALSPWGWASCHGRSATSS